MRFQDHRHRWEIYEGNEQLLDEVPRIGWADFLLASSFGMGHVHAHPECFEVDCVLRGRMRLRVGENVYEPAAGQILVIPPRQEHAGADPNDVVEPCQTNWIEFMLPSPAKAPWPPEEHQRILRTLRNVGQGVHRCSRETVWFFEHLLGEHRLHRPHNRQAARLDFYSLLVSLARDLEGKPSGAGAQPAITSAIRASMEWVQGRLDEVVTVDAMARRARLSLAQFHRRFAREVGMTPNQYLLRGRIAHAKRLLLETDRTVTQIAMECGFASSQYFATVFKQYADLTPLEFRRHEQMPGTR